MPAEPEVVGVDYERQLPANKSIYVGESARFLLVFDPVEFICNENDFSTSDDDVTVTMEEGADNVVRISVGETVGAGSVVEVRFRDQLIMNVTAEFLGHIQIDPLQFTLSDDSGTVACDTDLFEVVGTTDLSSTILTAEINGVLLSAESIRTHSTEFVYQFRSEDSSNIVQVYANGESDYFRANRFAAATGDYVVKWISFNIQGNLYSFNG